MLSDAAFNDDILTNLALSSISTQKKAGDRLIDKSSRVQKWQKFSESDRRGISHVYISESTSSPRLYPTLTHSETEVSHHIAIRAGGLLNQRLDDLLMISLPDKS